MQVWNQDGYGDVDQDGGDQRDQVGRAQGLDLTLQSRLEHMAGKSSPFARAA